MSETKGEKTHEQAPPQREQKHPDRYQGDLNPNHMAGQNIGADMTDREQAIRTAYEVKEIHRSLNGFADDDLKQIPILPNGARLQQGATYIDLADAPPREITAMGGDSVEPGHFIVPKDQVPYELWNRLIGEEKPGQ